MKTKNVVFCNQNLRISESQNQNHHYQASGTKKLKLKLESECVLSHCVYCIVCYYQMRVQIKKSTIFSTTIFQKCVFCCGFFGI